MLPTPDRLGPKPKDGETLVGVRGKDVCNCCDGSGVGREGGTVGTVVMKRVRLIGVAAVCCVMFKENTKAGDELSERVDFLSCACYSSQYNPSSLPPYFLPSPTPPLPLRTWTL